MQRAVTLVEVMVVTAMVGVVAAAAIGGLSDQARRQRAIDAARHALQPHQVARDRAVGARTCTETFLIPALGRGSVPTLPDGVPPITQRKNPMVAVVQWAKCGALNSFVRIDFFELDGEVDFSTYVGANDGRLVFAEDGAITSDLPTTGKAPGSALLPCAPPRPTGSETTSSSTRNPPQQQEGTCSAPPPAPPPPADVTFTATTFFGEAHGYHVYARVGATEAQ